MAAPRSQGVLVPDAVEAIFRDAAFRRAIDQMSVELQAVGQAFISDHLDVFAPLVQGGVDPREIISLVLGWVLGFNGAMASEEAREQYLIHHIALAAYAAGWSSSVCAPFAQRQVN